jgi:hypothetical protein
MLLFLPLLPAMLEFLLALPSGNCCVGSDWRILKIQAVTAVDVTSLCQESDLPANKDSSAIKTMEGKRQQCLVDT